MKNFILFFLSLTCLAAHAQYNQKRKTAKEPVKLSYYNSQRLISSSANTTLLNTPLSKLSYHQLQSGTTQSPGYTLYSNPAAGPVNASQQGYWSGSKMTSSGLNGRFQAIQSFDLQGNLRESKATYQFTNRKKR
jgi:hypothetical protein